MWRVVLNSWSPKLSETILTNTQTSHFISPWHCVCSSVVLRSICPCWGNLRRWGSRRWRRSPGCSPLNTRCHYCCPRGLVTTDLWWWPRLCRTGQALWRCCSCWRACSAWSCLCHWSVSSRSCSNHTRVCRKLGIIFLIGYMSKMILPHTYLIILRRKMVICTLGVIIEWFDAAKQSWTWHIMKSDTWQASHALMISLMSHPSDIGGSPEAGSAESRTWFVSPESSTSCKLLPF